MKDTGRSVLYGVNFEADTATLKKESAAALLETAKWLRLNSGSRVYIVGHTNLQGDLQHSVELAERHKAEAVVKELVITHGIARDRLIPQGVGPLAPVASNNTDAGKWKNRRIEMVLLP